MSVFSINHNNGKQVNLVSLLRQQWQEARGPATLTARERKPFERIDVCILHITTYTNNTIKSLFIISIFIFISKICGSTK